MTRARDLISKWLIEEGFEVRRFEGGITPPKVVWGLDVFTPPPIKLNLKVVQYEGREDRYFLLLGVGISPEHRKELDKLSAEERLRFSSKLISKVLSVCNVCNVGIQPSPLNPQAITIALMLFESDVNEGFKSRFVERLTLLINSFFTVVSVFNEEFPIVLREKHEGSYMMNI